MTAGILKIAIADDEPLARLRLQQLCEDLNGDCPNQLLGSYEHGSALINAAARWGQTGTPDVLLLDINMPGYLKKHAPALAVVFVTAEPQHALAAFEVAAIDYVLKPVRTERLLAALHKAKALSKPAGASAAVIEQAVIAVHDGERTVGLPLAQVLYFKSDNKATLVRTAERQYTSSQSLAELELWLEALPPAFVRVHRNALLRLSAAGAVSAVEGDNEVVVNGVAERLQVSRRMLASLKAV
jgi:two-component system, LytTR family, response regulator AlgR